MLFLRLAFCVASAGLLTKKKIIATHFSMKKQICIFFSIFLLIACNNKVDEIAQPSPVPSMVIQLNHPTGMGTSGDAVNDLLGYGYDLNGFCDTISVKAKVFSTFPYFYLSIDHSNSSYPTLISAYSFDELSSKLKTQLYFESGTVLSQHIKSLMGLAYQTDLLEPDFAYVYYSANGCTSHQRFLYNGDDQYLNPEFKKDALSLSANDLVSKYGTHVLTDVYTGYKFEVIYRCKFATRSIENVDFENLFYDRMKMFFGGAPMIYLNSSTAPKLLQTDEQMIYNSIGSRKKVCALIKVTDNNPDSIHLNINELFDSINFKPQFFSIGANGLLPIYELISNETKKQEVKAFIETYVEPKTVNY